MKFLKWSIATWPFQVSRKCRAVSNRNTHSWIRFEMFWFSIYQKFGDSEGRWKWKKKKQRKNREHSFRLSANENVAKQKDSKMNIEGETRIQLVLLSHHIAWIRFFSLIGQRFGNIGRIKWKQRKKEMMITFDEGDTQKGWIHDGKKANTHRS